MRTRLAVLSFLLAALVVVALPGTASATASGGHPGPRVVTIAQARALPLGTTVTVEGTVTTPSGVFASSYSDQGFAVQDRTAGIFVSFPTTNIGVRPPRHVVVTGVLQNPSGLLMIAPANAKAVQQKGYDRPVQPKQLRTGSVGTSNQGLLVRVAGKITQGPIDDLPYGHKLFVDDGSGAVNVYVNLGTKVDVSPYKVGQRVVVTGFSSAFGGVPEIDIRGPQDLTRVGR
jgi:uncharacterized protein YdeI (BOF family)